MHFLPRCARALGLLLVVGLSGCDSVSCPEETFEVVLTGTCATGPQRLMIHSSACEVTLGYGVDTGLPTHGRLSANRAPLRKGDFILFGDTPAFRLCKAKRVDFQLDIACVDDQGAPVCEAVLTEPP